MALFGAILGGAAAGLVSGLFGKSSSNRAANQVRETDLAALAEIRSILEDGRNAELAAIEAGNEAAAAAIRQAVAEALAVYDDYIDNIHPERIAEARTAFAEYRDFGSDALDELRKFTFGPFDPDLVRSIPGYDFLVEEGGRMVERGASARSGVLSGRANQELVRMAQDRIALPLFQDQRAALFTGAEVGLRATGAMQESIDRAYNDLANIFAAKAGVLGSQGAALADIALQSAAQQAESIRSNTNALSALISADATSANNLTQTKAENRNSLLDSIIQGATLGGTLFGGPRVSTISKPSPIRLDTAGQRLGGI